MRLIHYSDDYLTEIRDVEQGTGRACKRGDKPNGLWVSVEGEDDWLSWCRSEYFVVEKLTHPTLVALNQDANILHLVGEPDLRSFHERYWCYPPWGRDDKFFRGDSIRWEEVAEKYDGIVIAPYVWSMRLDPVVKWYYGWDCASGCIWNSRAVAELVPLPTLQQTDDRTNDSPE